jgi:Fe-S-cluster containining protein
MRCKKCGKCCSLVYILLGNDEEQKKLLEWRGLSIVDNTIVLDAPCKYLADNLCTIYDHKPEYCTKFPLKGQFGMPEGCGYDTES